VFRQVASWFFGGRGWGGVQRPPSPSHTPLARILHFDATSLLRRIYYATRTIRGATIGRSHLVPKSIKASTLAWQRRQHNRAHRASARQEHSGSAGALSRRLLAFAPSSSRAGCGRGGAPFFGTEYAGSVALTLLDELPICSRHSAGKQKFGLKRCCAFMHRLPACSTQLSFPCYLWCSCVCESVQGLCCLFGSNALTEV